MFHFKHLAHHFESLQIFRVPFALNDLLHETQSEIKPIWATLVHIVFPRTIYMTTLQVKWNLLQVWSLTLIESTELKFKISARFPCNYFTVRWKAVFNQCTCLKGTNKKDSAINLLNAIWPDVKHHINGIHLDGVHKEMHEKKRKKAC